jgi:hypothetical protein
MRREMWKASRAVRLQCKTNMREEGREGGLEGIFPECCTAYGSFSKASMMFFSWSTIRSVPSPKKRPLSASLPHSVTDFKQFTGQVAWHKCSQGFQSISGALGLVVGGPG